MKLNDENFVGNNEILEEKGGGEFWQMVGWLGDVEKEGREGEKKKGAMESADAAIYRRIRIKSK